MSNSASLMIARAIEANPEAPAVAFNGTWRDRRWLADYLAAVDDAIGNVRRIGLVSRNRPQHVAILIWSLVRRKHIIMLQAAQAAPALARQVAPLKLDALLADPDDWSMELRNEAAQCGIVALEIGDDPRGIIVASRGQGHERSEETDIAVSLLSSGTTGLPKQIPLTWPTLDGIIAAAGETYAGAHSSEAPVIMVHPLGNVAGVAYVAPAVARGQAIVLLEKFEAQAWASAVQRYKPLRAAIPPVGVRMVLDAGIAREDLTSLSLLAIGGGKLEIELQDRFEAMYGIPVLTAYGATEFGGVIASWTLDEYRRVGQAKRGSAGRPSGGAEIRIVDPEKGSPLIPGKVGLLEARVTRCGPDWIRTTDLASLDGDGFLFIHGRADGAINRGGFKIVPDAVSAKLAAHPAVGEAVIVGIPHDRLGQVPVAAVELTAGQSVTSAELAAWLREHVLAYEVPTEIKIVAHLPRNPSMKVRLDAVRDLFADS